MARRAVGKHLACWAASSRYATEQDDALTLDLANLNFLQDLDDAASDAYVANAKA